MHPNTETPTPSPKRERGAAKGLLAAFSLLAACAPLEPSGTIAPDSADASAPIGRAQEELSGGFNDLNDPIRNATVLFANGCSGTLIRNDVVLGAGHCGVLAEAWDTPTNTSQALANDWRSLGDRQQQIVTVTGDSWLARCTNAGTAPSTCGFQTHAIASSQNGCVDQILFLLDRPVPAAYATPSVPMSAAKLASIGGLAGHSFRAAGWGLLTGGGATRYRQTHGGAATFREIGVDPNTFRVNLPSGVSTQPGDSGSGIYWWDPGEARQYVVGDLQNVSTTPLYFGTFGDSSNPWGGANGVNGECGGDDFPANNISGWIQRQLASTDRTRFSPTAIDRWLPSMCSSNANEVCTMGDFDGDGDADIVRFTRGTVPLGNVFVGASRRFRSWRSGETDTGFALFGGALATGFASGNETVLTGDVSGDGKDDILYFERSGSYRTLARYSTFVASSTGYNPPTAGFSGTQAMMSTPVCQTDSTFCQLTQVVPGGRDELLEVDPTTGNVRVFSFDTGGGVLVSSFSLASACPSTSCTPLLGDFDGDGRQDLITISSTGYVYYRRNTGSGWAAPAYAFVTTLCRPLYGASCSLGDVNGDGRSDLVAFRSGGDVYASLAGGTTTRWHPGPFCSATTAKRCVVADVNGDGLSDIVAIRGTGGSSNPSGDVDVAISIYPRETYHP